MFSVYYQNQFIGSFPTIIMARQHITRNRLIGARIIDENQQQQEETGETFGHFKKGFSVIPRARRSYHSQRPYATVPTCVPEKTELLVGRKRRFRDNEDNYE